MTKVSRHQLRTRGASLLASGCATSAAKLNKRTGTVCPAGYFIVEGGKRISAYALSMSVGRAADAWLRRHGKGLEA